VADYTEVVGEDAVKICQKAQIYEQNCLSHAVDREVPELERRFPEGKEVELKAEIGGIINRYGLDPSGVAPNLPTPADHLLALTVGQRFIDAPFDEARCGKLSAKDCGLSYYESLRLTAADVDVSQICTPDASLDRVLAAHLPGWTPESATTALNVWIGYCKESMAGRMHAVANPWTRPE
jgi:hypothetical protein